MKTLKLCLFSAAMLMLTSCGFRSASDVPPVTESIGSVVDAGAVDLPNQPGYKLRSYVVLRQKRAVHYVYVVEKDGLPVTGAKTNYDDNKTSVALSSEVVPAATPAHLATPSSDAIPQ